MTQTLVIWFLGIVGSVALAGGVFGYIIWKYSELEEKVITFISSSANQIYDYLDRMFLRRSLQACYLIILIPTGVLGLIGFLLGIRMGISSGAFTALIYGGVVSFLFGYIGFKTPTALIKMRFDARLRKFDLQLVQALDMMSNAVKSGLSFMQVITVIEREMPNPCAEEFAMALKENRVGVNLSDALMNMTKRVPSEDLFMIINSVVTLSQQGGDLSEAFETIAMTIRERQKVSEKIRTLAQAGITQAVILSSMPFAMLLMMWFIQPNYVMLLFTTPIGLAMFGGMILMIAFGALWMKKILTIEI